MFHRENITLNFSIDSRLTTWLWRHMCDYLKQKYIHFFVMDFLSFESELVLWLKFYKMKLLTLIFISNDLEWLRMCYVPNQRTHVWKPSFENLSTSIIIIIIDNVIFHVLLLKSLSKQNV